MPTAEFGIPRLTYMHIYDMLICMRTTLIIDDHLMQRVKLRALQSGQTLTRTIEAALRAAVEDQPRNQPAFRLRWRPVRGRVLPGVDIADRDLLYERMEGRT